MRAASCGLRIMCLFLRRYTWIWREPRRRLCAGDAGEAVSPQRRSVRSDPGAVVDLKLKDKVAIVGGASQGIGFGIARTLAAEGVRLAITARREKPLREAAEKIGPRQASNHWRCRPIAAAPKIAPLS